MEKRNDLTLTDVINYKDFVLAFGAFLDAFRRSSNKSDMISSPPTSAYFDSDTSKVNLCVLAATVHKLANDNGLDVPAWALEPVYVMPSPFFGSNTIDREYQDFLLDDTPHEFASRNLFLGSGVLERA